MRQESNHRMNSGKGSRATISNSRAMGVIILIALLFVFQVTTFVIHKVRVASGGADAQSVAEGNIVQRTDTAERFSFNPNTIPKDSLVLLGFTPKQAQSIINYREKGGKFRKREDFAKLYVVDSAKYHSLAPYILLPDSNMSVDGDFAQKNDNFSAKSTVNEKFAQKNADPSTKLAGAEEGSVLDAGEMGRQDRRDSLFGHKVVQGRHMCNLNTADSAALVQLYGIGGYYARKILKYRERLGGSFVSPRQLLEIDGFAQERYSKIEQNIFVREEDIKGFSILCADRKTLENHPYIGPYAARGILTYLRLKGILAASVASSADQATPATTANTVIEADDQDLSARHGDKTLTRQAETELTVLKELVKERILTPENARKLEEYLLYL